MNDYIKLTEYKSLLGLTTSEMLETPMCGEITSTIEVCKDGSVNNI
jgi:hypothetical protein